MLKPVDTAGRVVGVDLARAIALVGMAATHIFPGFTADGDQHLSHALASGRAAALFALLAGVSLALSSGGHRAAEPSCAASRPGGVLARAALLVAVGLLLGQVDSPPLVILAYYGLLFVVAVPFLGLVEPDTGGDGSRPPRSSPRWSATCSARSSTRRRSTSPAVRTCSSNCSSPAPIRC